MRKRGTVIATSIGVMALFVARVAEPWVKTLPLAPLMFFAFLIVVGAGGPLLLLALTKDDNDA